MNGTSDVINDNASVNINTIHVNINELDLTNHKVSALIFTRTFEDSY